MSIKILAMSRPTQPQHIINLDIYDRITGGITTRVLAAKQIVSKSPNHSVTSSRRNSKFLLGTPVPNSTIRSILEGSNKLDGVKESNEEQTSTSKSSEGRLSEIGDERKLTSQERGLERMRNKIRSTSDANVPEAEITKRERRSSVLSNHENTIPSEKVPRSTVASIKKAIDDVTQSSKLVNVDSIERKATGHYYKNFKPQPKKIEKQDLQTQTSFDFSAFKYK